MSRYSSVSRLMIVQALRTSVIVSMTVLATTSTANRHSMAVSASWMICSESECQFMWVEIRSPARWRGFDANGRCEENSVDESSCFVGLQWIGVNHRSLVNSCYRLSLSEDHIGSIITKELAHGIQSTRGLA